MTKTVEVITSVERRRRWTAAEKERLVAASLEPGAVISALAREAGIHPRQLYGWRRQLCSAAPGVIEPRLADAGTDRASTFAAVRLASEPGLAAAAPMPVASTAPGAIEIEFAAGARMRITGAVDAATLSAVVAALARRERRR
jgi:transposase